MIKLVSVLSLVLFVSITTTSCGFFKNKNINSCQTYNSQLSSLTSLVCSNLYRTNITAFNACNACFMTAITANQNQPSLAQLSVCANTYLMGTNYAMCALVLGNDTISLAGRQSTGCTTGYCNFVRCLRRENSNSLISGCYAEALAVNNVTTRPGQINFYENMTSCILAKARCNPVNPITGASQNNRYTTTSTSCWRKTTRVLPLYNTLQITSGGDLQVVAFPGTTTLSTSFCSSASLAQSGWTNVTCA